MENKLKIKPENFTFFCENFLFFAVYCLCAFHLLLAAFCNIVPLDPFFLWEHYYIIGLLIISVIFLIVFPKIRQKAFSSCKELLSYEQIFMITMFLWFIIVCSIRQIKERLPYLQALDWLIMVTGISAFFLFPLPEYAGKKRAFPFIDCIIQLVVLSYTVFTILSLYFAVHLSVLDLPSGNKAGLRHTMQLQLGTHYNMTGAIACVMFALALYLLFSKKSVLLKLLYVVTSLIQLLVVLLSNSRTDFLATLFLIILVVFCYSWYCSGKHLSLSPLIRSIFCFVISFICALLFWNLRPAVITGFDHFVKAVNISGRQGGFSPVIQPLSAHCSPLAATARKITTDLNGRLDIWRAALKVIFHDSLSFFFGVTPVGITEALTTIGGLSEDFYGTHNAFLDVAVEFGVPAMLAFVVFTIRIILKCFRLLFSVKGDNFKRLFMLPLTIFTILVLNLTEGYLIGYFCIQSCIFFLFCGWIVALDKDSTPRKNFFE